MDHTSELYSEEKNQITTKAVIDALRAFVEQRPGVERVNYGSLRSYRQEAQEVSRDLRDAREILDVAQYTLSADEILDAARGTRLVITKGPYGVAVNYHAGQYWPTEYRKAVCWVLARALWDHNRQRFAASAKPGESADDAIRRRFRRIFGRRIASQYF